MFLRCDASTQESCVDWRVCEAVFVFVVTGIPAAIGVPSAAVALMIGIDGVSKLETNIILAIFLIISLRRCVFTGSLVLEKPNLSAVSARLSIISTGLLVRCLSDFRLFCTTTGGG